MGFADGDLTVLFGWEGTLTQMGWFFYPKSGVADLGGAYAVLPYVLPRRSQTLWVADPTQMIDGWAGGNHSQGSDLGCWLRRLRGAYVSQVFGENAGVSAGAVAASR